MQSPEIRFANGKQFVLQQHTSIGRDTINDICLEDASISSKHAVLEIKQGRVFLTDLSSTNGSFVNGEKVQIQEVRHDDQITIGLVKASLYMPLNKAQRTKRQRPATVITQKKSLGCLGWMTSIIASVAVALGGIQVFFDDQIDNFNQQYQTQGLSSKAQIMQAARASVKVMACLEQRCIERGSGIIIKLNGQLRVLTAYHVIEGVQKIEIRYNESDPYNEPETRDEAIKVKEDSNMDLALLRFCEFRACPSIRRYRKLG